jgi:tetratricopeptide (TPR) repeat protein
VRRKEEKAVEKAASVFVGQHSELNSLVPILLDRGDPQGRDFALNLARMAETPEMLAALCEFAFSNRGPDSLRMQALNVATKAGLVAPGLVRLWAQGEWREVQPMNYEIYTEPQHNYSPQVAELLRKGTEALYEGRANEAETLITQALELEPNSPPILNNLAAVYSQQDRVQEYRALLDQIHAIDPDYLFGRANLAHVYIHEGKLKEAREMLEPLLSRRRMHISECGAVYGAQIDLALAEGHREAAQGWLNMWEQVDPDHPNLTVFKRRLDAPPLLEKLAPVAEKIKQLTKRRTR